MAQEEEASVVISVLKIISFLLYFALWIYFEVKEFGSYTSKSFSINIILGFAFALSIIFFCAELFSLLDENEDAIR
ncbi:699_t:CDS:1, partial [Racocetra fulgida]